MISTTWVNGCLDSCWWVKIVVSSQVSPAAATVQAMSTTIGTHFLRGPVQVFSLDVS